MYINMRKLNRFYNTLIFITQRLKSVSRAEHELLNVEFEREGAMETIKPFNYNFFSLCCDDVAKNFVLAPRSLPINILLVIDCRTYLIHSTYLRALRHISIDCITILIEKNARRSYRQRPSDEKSTPNSISMSCYVCFIVSRSARLCNAHLSACVKIFTYNSLTSLGEWKTAH